MLSHNRISLESWTQIPLLLNRLGSQGHTILCFSYHLLQSVHRWSVTSNNLSLAQITADSRKSQHPETPPRGDANTRRILHGCIDTQYNLGPGWGGNTRLISPFGKSSQRYSPVHGFYFLYLILIPPPHGESSTIL